ncbi:MAG: dockerin type I repeat-containing protein [Deltaproteobacteria bacterium]|nr:dockerin type I repeat-containing protein [Deltaproteobacteria bacterium]
MRAKKIRPEFIFCIAMVLLAVSPLTMGIALSQDKEPDLWEQTLEEFKDLAVEKTYEKLDESFSEFSGTGIEPISKAQKILEVVDILGNLETSYNKIVAAQPSQQASIDFLEGVASLLDTLSCAPVPLVTDFFGWYATGIRQCVTLLKQLSVQIQQTCLLAVKEGDLDFALYNGGEEVVQELLRKQRQDALAASAAKTVARRQAWLKRKAQEIDSFCPTGNAETDPGKGFSLFVKGLVEALEKGVGKEGEFAGQFDRILSYTKFRYRALFEVTVPRDRLEEDYSTWMAGLVVAAKETLATLQAHVPLLREAADKVAAAQRALNYVRYIVADIGDDTEKETLSNLDGTAPPLWTLIGTLKTGIPSGEPVLTREGALQRFDDLVADHDRVATATQLRDDASEFLQQAMDFRQAMLDKLTAWKAAQPTAGTPYQTITSRPETTDLSADAVTEAVRRFPRGVDPRLQCRTVVKNVVEREEEVDGKTVLRTYYQFAEGGPHFQFDTAGDPQGILSAAPEAVTGLKGGYGSFTASTAGYPSFSYSLGVDYPTSDVTLQEGTLERKFSSTVHEYQGITLTPSVVRLFTPSTEWDTASDSTQVSVKYDFSKGTAYQVNPEEGNLRVTSSNEAVIGVEDARITHPHYGFGTFNLLAGEPGECEVVFSIVNDLGNEIHSSTVDDPADVLAARSLTVKSNRVRIYAGNVSLEGVPMEFTDEGAVILRGGVKVNAGDTLELRVDVEGPGDLSGYECQWLRYPGLTLYPEVEYPVTAFVGDVSTNRLKVPVGTKPGTSFYMMVKIRPSGSATPVFTGVVPGVQVAPAKLSQVSLFVGFPGEDPSLPEEPRLLNELHLFLSRTLYQPNVEVFPAGYFSDVLNGTVTKDVYRSTDYMDTVGLFHRYTNLMHVPGILQASSRADSATQDYFHFIKPIGIGVTALYSNSWAYSTQVYVDNDRGCVRSGNAIQVYVDRLSLEGLQFRKAAAGEPFALRLNVPTEGDLSDYECLWSLTAGVEGLAAEVTGFVKGADGVWSSENLWSIASDLAGQTVSVDVAIRYKGSLFALGKDRVTLSIVAPLLSDVNADGTLTLADVILILKIINGQPTAGETVRMAADISQDSRIGLEEAVHLLHEIAQMRD